MKDDLPLARELMDSLTRRQLAQDMALAASARTLKDHFQANYVVETFDDGINFYFRVRDIVASFCPVPLSFPYTTAEERDSDAKVLFPFVASRTPISDPHGGPPMSDDNLPQAPSVADFLDSPLKFEYALTGAQSVASIREYQNSTYTLFTFDNDTGYYWSLYDKETDEYPVPKSKAYPTAKARDGDMSLILPFMEPLSRNPSDA